MVSGFFPAYHSANCVIQVELVKRFVSGILLFSFSLALSIPVAAYADSKPSQRSAQEHNLRQSRKDMKRMSKERKKFLKSEAKAARARKK
jgi:hypothetical protein